MVWHSGQGHSRRKNSHEYIPLLWPSFQWKLIAYFPTGSTSSGRAGSLYMGSAPGFAFAGWPIFLPEPSRSSLHVAQGHASRSQVKEYWLWCPSFHSISMPFPVLFCTFTDFGSVAATGRTRDSSACTRAISYAGPVLIGSWDIDDMSMTLHLRADRQRAIGKRGNCGYGLMLIAYRPLQGAHCRLCFPRAIIKLWTSSSLPF
jgi:hypothetical protein